MRRHKVRVFERKPYPRATSTYVHWRASFNALHWGLQEYAYRSPSKYGTLCPRTRKASHKETRNFKHFLFMSKLETILEDIHNRGYYK